MLRRPVCVHSRPEHTSPVNGIQDDSAEEDGLSDEDGLDDATLMRLLPPPARPAEPARRQEGAGSQRQSGEGGREMPEGAAGRSVVWGRTRESKRPATAGAEEAARNAVPPEVKDRVPLRDSRQSGTYHLSASQSSGGGRRGGTAVKWLWKRRDGAVRTTYTSDSEAGPRGAQTGGEVTQRGGAGARGPGDRYGGQQMPGGGVAGGVTVGQSGYLGGHVNPFAARAPALVATQTAARPGGSRKTAGAVDNTQKAGAGAVNDACGGRAAAPPLLGPVIAGVVQRQRDCARRGAGADMPPASGEECPPPGTLDARACGSEGLMGAWESGGGRVMGFRGREELIKAVEGVTSEECGVGMILNSILEAALEENDDIGDSP